MSPKEIALSRLPADLREEFLETLRALGIVRDDDELIRVSALLSIVLRAFAKEGEDQHATTIRLITELKSETDQAKTIVAQLREAGRHGVTWQAVLRAKLLAGVVLTIFAAVGAYGGATIATIVMSKKLDAMMKTVETTAATAELAARQLKEGQAAVAAYNELAEKYKNALLMGAVMARVFNATPKANVSFFNDEIVVGLPPGMVRTEGSAPEYDLFRIRRDPIGTGVDGANFQHDMEKLEAVKKSGEPPKP